METSAVLRHQRELNQGSADRWDDFAAHRRRVTDLILGHRAGRLMVLGAGNCNDLDLRRLSTAFAAIHLVDIDAEALADGVARQRMAPGAQLHLHGGIDLTDTRPDQLPAADVVVSTTLLTQLIDVAAGSGADLLTVRDHHLRLIHDLAAPRGTGMLITDVVSSDTCPPLRQMRVADLGSLLANCVNTGNFFTGTNPFAIEQRLRTDPALRTARIGMAPPWRWDLGERSYLVSALAFRKHPG